MEEVEEGNSIDSQDPPIIVTQTSNESIDKAKFWAKNTQDIKELNNILFESWEEIDEFTDNEREMILNDSRISNANWIAMESHSTLRSWDTMRSSEWIK